MGVSRDKLIPVYLPHGTLVSRHWEPEYVELVTQVEADKGYAICGAKKRRFDEHTSPESVCRQIAGHNTAHPGEGRCKRHGGNKPVTHGKYTLLRHHKVGAKVLEFLEAEELLDLRQAVATAWALLDEVLGDDATITPDRLLDAMGALQKIGVLVKQHHDITEGQKIVIEVPQFMQWAEALYELAVKYIDQAGGDVVAFLTEAEAYFNASVGTVVRRDRAPALGPGGAIEVT